MSWMVWYERKTIRPIEHYEDGTKEVLPSFVQHQIVMKHEQSGEFLRYTRVRKSERFTLKTKRRVPKMLRGKAVWNEYEIIEETDQYTDRQIRELIVKRTGDAKLADLVIWQAHNEET